MTRVAKVLIMKFGLTNRQAEVAEHVISGKRNKEVASDLGVSEQAIKFHLTKIFKLTKASDRVNLAQMVFRLMERKNA